MFAKSFRREFRNLVWTYFFRQLSCFRYFLIIKSILNTMTCICSGRETPRDYLLLNLCVLKKKESSVQFFCVISRFHIPKLFDKAATKHLLLVILEEWNVVKTSTKFSALRDHENCDYTHFCSENPTFCRTCLLISCLIYWYHSDLIQIKFCEKILRRG